MKQIAPRVYQWSQYDAGHELDRNGYFVQAPGAPGGGAPGALIDPVDLSPEDAAHVERLGGAAAVLFTSAGVARAARGLRALLARRFDRLLPSLGFPVLREPAAALQDLLYRHVVLMLTVESLAGQPGLRDAIRTVNAALRESLREQLVRGQADGSIRPDVDAGAESLMLAGLLRGLTVQWLADAQSVDLRHATETAVALAGRAYAPG